VFRFPLKSGLAGCGAPDGLSFQTLPGLSERPTLSGPRSAALPLPHFLMRGYPASDGEVSRVPVEAVQNRVGANEENLGFVVAVDIGKRKISWHRGQFDLPDKVRHVPLAADGAERSLISEEEFFSIQLGSDRLPGRFNQCATQGRQGYAHPAKSTLTLLSPDMFCGDRLCDAFSQS